jgi:thiamine pyrophosphokinase
MSIIDQIREWNPLAIFADNPPVSSPTALIILNQPITKENESKLVYLWKNSTVRFCVDGGTNRLHEWCLEKARLGQTSNNNNTSSEFYNRYVPDYICGDLDSLDESIKTFYMAKGTKCIRLTNQDATDFSKTLQFAINCVSLNNCGSNAELLSENDPTLLANIQHFSLKSIYCFCDFSGRLDHAISNLNSLYDECIARVNTFIVSSESVTFLLSAGKNLVFVDDEFRCGKYCGFFSLGEPSTVTTRGFKWDVSQQLMKFGSFVSTSNEFDMANQSDLSSRRHVFVETDKPLLFTMSII